MRPVQCVFVENFESIRTKFFVQREIRRGRYFKGFADINVIHLVGRGHSDPTPDTPLGEGISLIPEPANPVDKHAIMVCRHGQKIGYILRTETKITRQLASSPDVLFVNSNHHLFAVTMQ